MVFGTDKMMEWRDGKQTDHPTPTPTHEKRSRVHGAGGGLSVESHFSQPCELGPTDIIAFISSFHLSHLDSNSSRSGSPKVVPIRSKILLPFMQKTTRRRGQQTQGESSQDSSMVRSTDLSKESRNSMTVENEKGGDTRSG